MVVVCGWSSDLLEHLITSYVMRCAIWYHLYNLLNVKNTYGGVLLFVSLQAKSQLKVTLLHECFSRFLNCMNGTKSRKTSQLVLKKWMEVFYGFNVFYPISGQRSIIP